MKQPQGEHRAQLNGIDLWYRVSGRGPVCLAPSPAWGASSDYLFRSLEPLDALFTMVYLDTRGTGRSERPSSPVAYTWENLTADLEALRRHLRQERIWLMGHSYAGAQAMQYALEHPAHVAGLVLIDTHAADDANFAGDMTARRLARQHEPWYAEANPGWELEPRTDEELERMLQILLPFYFVDQEHRERNAAAFAAMSASIQAWRAESQRSPFSLVDRLAEIQAPTLVVVGSGDFICSPRQAQRVHHGIAGSKLLLVEDAGHFPWMEQPDAFYDGLRQILPLLGYRCEVRM
jgi:proline iminopeptidase